MVLNLGSWLTLSRRTFIWLSKNKTNPVWYSGQCTAFSDFRDSWQLWICTIAYSEHQISKLSGRLWTDDLALNLQWHWESLRRRKTQLFTSALGWFVWSLSILFPHWWAVKAQHPGQYIVTTKALTWFKVYCWMLKQSPGTKRTPRTRVDGLFCCVGGIGYKVSTRTQCRSRTIQVVPETFYRIVVMAKRSLRV